MISNLRIDLDYKRRGKKTANENREKKNRERSGKGMRRMRKT